MMDNYTLLIPKKEKTTHDTIILILMTEWPLTTKGIYRRLNQYSNKTCSIQATYKATKKLFLDEIIEKEGQFYRLNHSWLKEINEISEELLQKYESTPILLKDLP